MRVVGRVSSNGKYETYCEFRKDLVLACWWNLDPKHYLGLKYQHHYLDLIQGYNPPSRRKDQRGIIFLRSLSHPNHLL